jgi:hypothetical protein
MTMSGVSQADMQDARDDATKCISTDLFRSVQALYVVLLLQDTLLGILSSGVTLFSK